MTAELMNPEPQSCEATERPEPRALAPDVQSIIDRARATRPLPGSKATWIISAVWAVLMYASFPPINWGPLAWLALLPLALLVRIPTRTRWMYPISYLGGLAVYLPLLQWMRLGDPSMYLAWFALALYVALFVPAFVWLARTAVHRCHVPLIAAVPVTWVALEYARAHLLTGFGWYFLGHSQYRWSTLIQISDLVGAYGVSFVVAMAATGLAALVPSDRLRSWRLILPDEELPSPRPRQMILTTSVCLLAFAAVLGYGFLRRSQADFQPGPRVALIQGNFTSTIKHDPAEAQRIFNQHYQLSESALVANPDLIVWPETMFRNALFEVEGELTPADLNRVAPKIPSELWYDTSTRQLLTNISQTMGAPMVVGLESGIANQNDYQHYNSAALVTPDGGVSGRYDKIHRVPFGEYIPYRDALPWLDNFSPYGPESGIDAGKQAVVFGIDNWRMSPTICFEDTVPHLVRNIVRSTQDPETGDSVDFLVNLTNDGWFHGSSELDQHLITSIFRAVECRTPLLRAVNTGISAFIDGDGVVLEPEQFIDGDGQERKTMIDPTTGSWRKQLNAALIHTVPVDNRRSLYVLAGDWFAMVCGLMALLCVVVGYAPRSRQPASGMSAKEQSAKVSNNTTAHDA